MNQPFNQQSTNILFPLAITMKFDRVDQIRDWRLCLGCGACVAACPDKNLVLRDVSVRGLRPVLKSDDCQHCGRCVQVCPGIEMKHPFSEKSVLEEWGPIQELWEGYATDPQLRFRSSSGGAATAIASYCLKEASAGGVLHTGVHLSEPLRNIPVFSRTYEALLACAGSRYSPAGPCEKLEWIHNAAGSCVFIGKPCDVAALRKYQAVFPEIKEKVMAAISIFCAGTPSTEGTLRVLAKMGVSVGDVDAFRYRGYGWPGDATAVTKTGVQTHKLTYQECWGDILSRYVPFRCRLCPDSTGEFADISCGDPWYRKDESNEPGRSLVIIRTDRGRDIVRRAVESGYLVLEPVSSEVIALSQRSLLYKRRQMWARLKTLNLVGVPVPNYAGFDLYGSWKRLSVVEQFKSFAGTLRRAIRRKWYRPDSQEAIVRVVVKDFSKKQLDRKTASHSIGRRHY